MPGFRPHCVQEVCRPYPYHAPSTPCSLRLWTLRTVSPCKVWELGMSDITRIMRLYPRLSSRVLHFIKVTLISELSHGLVMSQVGIGF